MAQLNTGAIEGRARPGQWILITGANGFRHTVRADSRGAFFVVLPYGRYRMEGATVFVAPLETAHTAWTAAPRNRTFPEPFSLTGLLAAREPAGVTEPLDFTGLHDNRLGVESRLGFSWTGTRHKFQGMDATDSWQPGEAAIFPDVEALEEVTVRPESEVGLFLAEPGTSWHGSLGTANTGAGLSATNLPPPAGRGLVEQPDRFQWWTRGRAEAAGPLGRLADVYASASGQWASQTEPLRPPGVDQQSRLLFANARGRVRASRADQFDAVYSGSRINLSDGGVPAGLEALSGNRLAPSFVLPGGFSGQPEVDHFDLVHAGWTRLPPADSWPGVLEARYGYSTAHLDTSGVTAPGQTRVELAGGSVTGEPPLANLAVRTRHEFAASWQPAGMRTGRIRHRLAAGGGWETSAPRNRFTAPSDSNFISAGGAPAFVMELNTPLDSREIVRSSSAWAHDQIRLASLSLDLGILADFPRGSLPAQGSPAGIFTPARTFAARGDLIVWNSLAPRAGFAWQVPHAHGLTLRASWFRLYAPLAGRYLDFGNPNSLGGCLYQWEPQNRETDTAVHAAQNRGLGTGVSVPGLLPAALVARFGGPYSSISPALTRPYSDEIDVGAELPLTAAFSAGVRLFRRDDRDRIAAIDAGVPAQAFTPVSIPDPGPDGIPGTFDDARLTVYAQNPATFGQDRYLLTNPPGLRFLNTGLEAEAGARWRGVMVRASFAAEKSYGPTNPGDAFYENDPGVTGALFLDPNTAVNAANRIYMDRAFVGKIAASWHLPWGGIEVASLADYTDGLVFARQLLVAGLPQGPILVAATVRGSPEGGNRAEYAINWNLRIARQFRLPAGNMAVTADIMNVTNAGQSLQQSDLSGPAFNLRLPVEIQPPRFVRLGFRYQF